MVDVFPDFNHTMHRDPTNGSRRNLMAMPQ